MASRSVRVSDPNFDPKGWEAKFGKDHVNFIQSHYYGRTLEVATASRSLKHAPKFDSNKAKEAAAAIDPAAIWHPHWYYASTLCLTSAIHNTVLKKDIPNLVHPFLRRAAKPIVAATVFGSMANTAWLCSRAQLDNRTTAYQTAATGTWQLANNIIFPLFAFRAVSLFLPSSAPVVYGAALMCFLSPVAIGCLSKDRLEGSFMKRRFNRKDYGTHGHATDLESLQIDSPAQQIEQLFNNEGSEHIIHTRDEDKFSYLFPMFSLAEALPTHEVPYHGGEIATLQPLSVAGTILQLSMEPQLNGKDRAIPAPTPSTSDRFTARYGDWSIATPYQAAADMMAVPYLRRNILHSILSDQPSPLATSQQKDRNQQ